MIDLIDLHIQHKYYIEAQKLIQLNAVQLSYPPSVIYEKKDDEDVFIYHSVDDYMIVYKNDVNSEPLCQLKSPNYTHRVLLLEDVYLTCIQKSFDTDLIVCRDENSEKIKGKQPLLKLMDVLTDEEDIQKEKNLSALFFELVLGEDGLSKADKFDVVNGYRIISNVFKNRGICK